MIDYITGRVAELNPAYVVVDNHGVGYMLHISLTTHHTLQETLGEAKLFVYEAIREDAHLLFGFASKHERELFLLLISVSGVGPNTARVILSSIPPAELEQAIAGEQVARLKAVKGVGAKTAQRIIVDLKDKIKVGATTLLNTDERPGEAYDEALAALMMLGFTQQMSQKALKKLFQHNPSLGAEEAIKQALKMM